MHPRHTIVPGNCKGDTMNRHTLTYIDLHPEPVKRDYLGELLGFLACLSVACVGMFLLVCLMVLPELLRQ